MFNIVLFEPEIPPNTGNIIRLCANTGMQLHLIQPMAFQLDDKQLRRAGLDYREWAELIVHDNWSSFMTAMPDARLFACTTKGQRNHCQVSYQKGDCLVFGPESRGLPDSILQSLPAEQRLRIPMRKESRSLNLSNAVAIFAYEAWRQLDFEGGD